MAALIMEIQFQARVQCVDGLAGELAHAIVQPATRKVVGIVVREAEAPHTERLVPFHTVEEARAEQIRLRCSRQELAEMQPFLRTEFVETTSWWRGRGPAEFEKVQRENIPDDEVALDADVQVRASDGNAGRVARLTVDPRSGAITRVSLRESVPWPTRLVTVLISEVENIGGDALTLKLDRAAVEAMRAREARKK